MSAALWVGLATLVAAHLALLPTSRVALTAVTKVLLVPFLVAAVVSAGGVPGGSARLVLAGLALGWIGDILLLRKSSTAFLAGLALFLAGHCAYMAWFSLHIERVLYWPIVAAVAILVPAAAFMWRFAGPVRVPAILYGTALCALVVLAASAWGSGWQRGAAATAGAILFLLSDAILGMREFTDWIGEARIPVMITYIPAQLLIALTAIEPVV